MIGLPLVIFGRGEKIYAFLEDENLVWWGSLIEQLRVVREQPMAQSGRGRNEQSENRQKS